jgi:hypothetical protein
MLVLGHDMINLNSYHLGTVQDHGAAKALLVWTSTPAFSF